MLSPLSTAGPYPQHSLPPRYHIQAQVSEEEDYLWRRMPVIPSTWEAEAGGSLGVGDQSGIYRRPRPAVKIKPISHIKKKKTRFPAIGKILS